MPDDHLVDDGRIAESDKVGALFLIEDLRCDENVLFSSEWLQRARTTCVNATVSRKFFVATG